MGSCPVCGAAHASAARFCSTCGAALPLTCARCGTALRDDDRFCSSCGLRVGDDVPETAPDTAPAAAADVAADAPADETSAGLATHGEERKLVTVLFADLVGSTTLADGLDPERLREILQRYFDAMRQEIEAEGGTVEKFIGDAVMAAFGVPTSHEDDAARAVHAALAMQRRLGEVNAALGTTYGVALNMRIGINTGDVLAATDPRPGQPMVTGDVVNVAARLQTAAEPGEVVVSERTARGARGFLMMERGSLELRGRRRPVRAFTVTGMAGGSSRGVPYLTAPMVGRRAELDVLETVYARTLGEGRPHVVTVYGDPGVGKSRLVREFLGALSASEAPPVILTGRCLPYGDGVTYWPLAEMLKRYAGVTNTDSRADALAKIQAATLEVGAAVDGVGQGNPTAAMLAYTAGVQDRDDPVTKLDPQEVKRGLHLAWRVLLSGLALGGPVVVVVEDIHWADAALLDLLDELGDRAIGPVLIICPSRPDLVASRPGWGGGRRNAVAVSLDPLPPTEAERLVGALLTVEDLPRSVHDRILERAEGNPFFLEEILRRLIDSGHIVRVDDRWQAGPGIEKIDIPDSVQAVLAARIDLLDPQDKRVLQAAAVVGRAFWLDPLTLLVGADTDVEASLRRLEERELVLPRVGSSLSGRTEWSFKHILTRDVAYASLPRRGRATAHAVVGHWLERTAGERAGEFSELLAHHFGAAVSLDREAGVEPDEPLREAALRWLLQASEDARCRFVTGKAERLGHAALELAHDGEEKVHALRAVGDAAMTAVRGDVAFDYYLRAAQAADGTPGYPPLETACLYALAVELPMRWPGMMKRAADPAQAWDLLARGIELAGPGDSPERATLLALNAAWPFAFPGEGDQDIEVYAERGLQAVEIAHRLGDVELESACYDSASAAYTAVGDYVRSMEIWRKRWELRDQVTSDLESVDIYAMGSWHSFELGEYEQAVRYAQEVSIGEHMDYLGANHAYAWLGSATFRLGRWDETLDVLAACRERLDTRRDDPPNYMTHLYAVAAIIHTVRGNQREADREWEIIDRLPPSAVRAYAWGLQLLAQRGQLERLRAGLAARPAAWQIHASVVWESRCDAIPVLGNWGAATATASGARTYSDDGGGGPTPRLFADRLEGIAAAVSGDEVTAVRLLSSAADGFVALATPWEEARTRQVLAAVLERGGDAAEAASQRDLADPLLARLGVRQDAYVDAALAALSGS